MAFRSPVFGSDEYYPASVCGAILGMRKASRLQRALVRERQIAVDATAFTFDLPTGSDLLIVDVTARPEISSDRLEAEVGAEIDRIHERGVTQREVDRAVTLIETDFVSSMQQASERADHVSKFATYCGDPSLVNVQTKRYRAVTAAQVTAFAAERLGVANRASLLYVPRPPDPDPLGTAQSIDADRETVLA
jgi:predicted Zn-dependent peptidase